MAGNATKDVSSWEFLPIFIHLQGRNCLVVGGTAEAARKTELLLRAGGMITLVADQLHESFSAVGDDRINYRINYCANSFNESLLDDVHLVVAATADFAVDKQVADAAKERRLPINVVAHPELSSFIFPSVIDRSPVMVAVSSGGDAPVLTRFLRSKLESVVPHAYGRLALLVGEFRSRVKTTFKNMNARRRFWESVLQGTAADLVFSGREDKAKELIEEQLAAADNYSDKGEVYLVGAGPGDPDLLTFKALRLMRQADVVLYDRLVAPEILDMARRDAEKINVGKARSNHTLPQQEINELLVTLAKQGKRVLRLKGGDPFIFGRGGEEIDQLAAEGIPFEVVPGITAASGCAAYSGIPLTHRDYSQSVRFVTGHLKDNTCNLPWHELIHERQTLVFYMGLVGLPVICRQLLKYGMRESMPVALVSKGSMPDQRVITGELATIVDEVSRQSEPVSAPTIIIVGDVVRLREKLAWLD